MGVGDHERGSSDMVVWEGPSALVIFELNSEGWEGDSHMRN